jgi:hypothetical protein
MPGFFRPVGDLTLKWTWQLFGSQPFYFFLGNALLHGINSWLLFLVCRRLFADRRRALWFACIASVIFFTYHSHGEAILWAIGRGISLATSFALLGMLLFLSRIHEGVKVFLVCVCYFLALACYESVVLLPVILWLLSKTIPVHRNFRKWWIALGITLLGNVVLRETYSGGVWMGYKGSIVWKDGGAYLSDTLKIILRVFTPAFNMPMFFAAAGCLLILAVSSLIFLHRKTLVAEAASRNVLRLALGGLLCAVLVAMVFSISTRTTEGDRLLYFPACFFAMLISLLATQFKVSPARWLVVSTIVVVQIGFLIQTRNNWMRASAYAKQIIEKISDAKARPLYIVNLPEEFKGAYIFRNCLPEALTFYGVNAGDVHIMNRLGFVDAQQKNGVIIPEEKGSDIFIWPGTRIEATNIPPESVLFWDKETLRSLR